jgi:hypothetical protein
LRSYVKIVSANTAVGVSAVVPANASKQRLTRTEPRR